MCTVLKGRFFLLQNAKVMVDIVKNMTVNAEFYTVRQNCIHILKQRTIECSLYVFSWGVHFPKQLYNE